MAEEVKGNRKDLVKVIKAVSGPKPPPANAAENKKGMRDAQGDFVRFDEKISEGVKRMLSHLLHPGTHNNHILCPL